MKVFIERTVLIINVVVVEAGIVVVSAMIFQEHEHVVLVAEAMVVDVVMDVVKNFKTLIYCCSTLKIQVSKDAQMKQCHR